MISFPGPFVDIAAVSGSARPKAVLNVERRNMTNQDASSLRDKVEAAKKIVREAFDRFDKDRIAVAWTGGKDSTLVLWHIREVCVERKIPIPRAMFINEGYQFDEILDFKERMREAWSLNIAEVKNDDVLRFVKKPGDVVRVGDLDRRNQEEVRRLDASVAEFVWEPESFIGNHLMKTAVMNRFIEDYRIEALFTGVRWDEQQARQAESPFSPRERPPHTRVHAILQFTERDVWTAIRSFGIPHNTLYAQGYRSLGTKDTTVKTSDVPAWEQDLENTDERGGRRQDKENLMQQLRDLGYM
jgi:phosphoadenosine phosphosulfate reductase